MTAKLVRSRSLFEVPADLTYFVHGEDRLVVNPHVGARCVLTAPEFQVLATLAAGTGELAETPQTERALAKLILNWIVYYNGNKPVIALGEAPLGIAYYAITDGCNLR